MHNLLRNDTEGNFSRGDSRSRSKSSRARADYELGQARFLFECFLHLRRPTSNSRRPTPDAADQLIKYHQSSRLSVPADAVRNVCLRRIARVRLGVIYRGGLSECQKYRIIIPRVRALASFARVRGEFTTRGYQANSRS